MNKLSDLINEIEETELPQVSYQDLLAAIKQLPPLGTIPEFKYEPSYGYQGREEMDCGYYYAPYMPIIRNPAMGIIANMTA